MVGPAQAAEAAATTTKSLANRARLVGVGSGDVPRWRGLLDHSGDGHWAEWMRRSAAEIRVGDGHGVSRVLRAYGGIGSFNDLVFADARLGLPRSRIFMLADRLRRERL